VLKVSISVSGGGLSATLAALRRQSLVTCHLLSSDVRTLSHRFLGRAVYRATVLRRAVVPFS